MLKVDEDPGEACMFEDAIIMGNVWDVLGRTHHNDLLVQRRFGQLNWFPIRVTTHLFRPSRMWSMLISNFDPDDRFLDSESCKNNRTIQTLAKIVPSDRADPVRTKTGENANARWDYQM